MTESGSRLRPFLVASVNCGELTPPPPPAANTPPRHGRGGGVRDKRGQVPFWASRGGGARDKWRQVPFGASLCFRPPPPLSPCFRLDLLLGPPAVCIGAFARRYGNRSGVRIALYGHPWQRVLFSPIEQLDRTLFPARWGDNQ